MGHSFTRPDGLVYPSVTRVISDVLKTDFTPIQNYWRSIGKDPKKELKRLADIGTLCHYRLFSQLSDERLDPPDLPLKDFPEDSALYCDLVELMWNKTGLKVEKGGIYEKFTVSHKYGLVGTFDMLAKVSGTIYNLRDDVPEKFKTKQLDQAWCLCDLKTAKNVQESHLLQLGGYSLFLDVFPQYGVVMCFHPFEKHNPQYEPRLYLLTSDELFDYQVKFKKILKQWWEDKNDDRFKISFAT